MTSGAEPNADILGDFLDRAAARPVLADVGASGAPHGPWRPVAHKSVFVGFDPDSRDIDPALGKAYAEHHIIPKIVAGPETSGTAPFYLTSFPHCSSMVEPDAEALEPYLFADLFTVDKTVEVATVTLADAIGGLGIDSIDWLKVDSQGRDLSVINGLGEDRINRLLCVEIEPGFSPFYRDEESFFDIHLALTGKGYWLAHLKAQQFPRVRASTVKAAFGVDIKATDPAAILFGRSPTAAEARYFPDVRVLNTRDAPMRDYAVLWSFAVATEMWGYALEIGLAAKGVATNSHESGLAAFMFDSVKATIGGLANQMAQG